MTVTIGRRELLAALGGAVAWPLAARAQQPTKPVIGVLRSTTAAGSEHFVAAFREGLKEIGYIEGERCGRIPLGKRSTRTAAITCSRAG